MAKGDLINTGCHLGFPARAEPSPSSPQSTGRAGSGGSGVGDPCGDVAMLVWGGWCCLVACKGLCLSEEKPFGAGAACAAQGGAEAAPGQGRVTGVVWPSVACTDKDDADGGGWREQIPCPMGRRVVPELPCLASTAAVPLARQRAGPDITFGYPKGGKTGDVEAEDSRIWR